MFSHGSYLFKGIRITCPCKCDPLLCSTIGVYRRILFHIFSLKPRLIIYLCFEQKNKKKITIFQLMKKMEISNAYMIPLAQ